MASETQVRCLAGANLFSHNHSYFQTPRPLACKIHLDAPYTWNDETLGFFIKQFPFPWYIRTDLTDLWTYGQVLESTSGYHGEFFTPDEPTVSLIHLGNNKKEAVRMMKHLTQQHMHILAVKDCQLHCLIFLKEQK